MYMHILMYMLHAYLFTYSYVHIYSRASVCIHVPIRVVHLLFIDSLDPLARYIFNIYMLYT